MIVLPGAIVEVIVVVPVVTVVIPAVVADFFFVDDIDLADVIRVVEVRVIVETSSRVLEASVTAVNASLVVCFVVVVLTVSETETRNYNV